jgi:arabinofuranosyltransferase
MRTNLTKYRSLIPFVLMGIVFLIIWIYFFNGLVYDDAYIAYRFSNHWATGQGLVWNAGENPVEGFTSFAWVLLGTIFQLIGILPHTIMPWIGVAAWFIAIAVLVPKLVDAILTDPADLDTSRQKGIKILVFLVVAANSALAFQAFHGLETTLFVMAILLVTLQGIVSRTSGDFIKLAVFSLFLLMVRPDGAVIFIPIWLLTFLFSPGSRKNVLAGLGVMLVLIGAYMAAKWLYFGYPFPNTFYIKEAPEALSGQYYVRDYLTILSPLLIFMLYTAGRLGVVRTLTDKIFMILITPAILFTLAYIGINPILGTVYRFLIPSLPLFVLAGLRIWWLANEKADVEIQPKKTILPLALESLLFLALALVTVNVVFNIRVYRQYDFLKDYFGGIEQGLVPRGLLLQAANRLSPPPLMATGDVGAVPYYSNLPTLDIIGLADETIAHQGLKHDYILARKPDLLILQDFKITKNVQILACGPQGYTNQHLVVDDKKVQLDLAFYSKVLDTPEQAHTSKGSTYQIVTTPGFDTDYQYITTWNPSGHSAVFVRRAYAQFDALVKLVKSIHH